MIKLIYIRFNLNRGNCMAGEKKGDLPKDIFGDDDSFEQAKGELPEDIFKDPTKKHAAKSTIEAKKEVIDTSKADKIIDDLEQAKQAADRDVKAVIDASKKLNDAVGPFESNIKIDPLVENLESAIKKAEVSAKEAEKIIEAIEKSLTEDAVLKTQIAETQKSLDNAQDIVKGAKADIAAATPFTEKGLKAAQDIAVLNGLITQAEQSAKVVAEKASAVEGELVVKVADANKKLEEAGAKYEKAVIAMDAAHKSGEKIDEARAEVKSALDGVNEAKREVENAVEQEKQGINETNSDVSNIKENLTKAKEIENPGEDAKTLIIKLEEIVNKAEENQIKTNEIGAEALSKHENNVSEFDSKISGLEKKANASITDYDSGPLKSSREAIAKLNVAREKLLNFDTTKEVTNPFDTLEIAKQNYIDAQSAVKNLQDKKTVSGVDHPDAVKAGELLTDALKNDVGKIKNSVDIAVANLNTARKDLDDAKAGTNPFALSMEEAKQKHAKAEAVAVDLFQKYSEIKNPDVVRVFELLDKEMEKDYAEMEKYRVPTPTPKPTSSPKSATKIGGDSATEKNEYDLSVFTEDKYKVNKDANNQAMIFDKNDKPLVSVSPDGSMKMLVSLANNKELTGHVLEAQKKQFGDKPIPILCTNPAEIATFEKVAKDMGIQIKIAATPEEHNKNILESSQPKPEASATQTNPDNRFSDPNRPNVMPGNLANSAQTSAPIIPKPPTSTTLKPAISEDLQSQIASHKFNG